MRRGGECDILIGTRKKEGTVMEGKKEVTGHLLALVTVFIWGTTFISTKVLLGAFSPVEILFLRFTAGFLALSLACPQPMKVADRRHELYFAAAGISGVTLYFLFENIALTYTFASNVGVIVAVNPFFTAVLAHFFIKSEKLRLQFFIGFALALCGIALISFSGSHILKLNPLGDILAVLAALVWAAYSIIVRKIGEFGYTSIQTTRRIFFYGLVFMAPALFLLGFSPDIAQLGRPVILFNILFLGLGASALCFATWDMTIKILGVVKTSAYIYMVPVVTVVASVLVLKEIITPMAALGALLTLAGLFLSEGRLGFLKKKEEKIEEAEKASP